MSTSTNNSSTIFIPTAVPDHDPQHLEPSSEQALTETNRVTRVDGRPHKRDLATVERTEEATKEASQESSAKKPATQYAIDDSDSKAALDIDSKHADDPQYASLMAPQLFSFLRHYETLVLPGTREPIQPAKPYDNLEATRLRCINQMFGINTYYGDQYHHVATDTIHLAIYYLDRFLERYKGTKQHSMSLIALTALFTASKYEDVEPAPTDTYAKDNIFGRGLDQDKVLALEIPFQEALYILTGPTSTAFALRYLQAVDLETNKAAVYTARYFCALGVSCFSLSGQYYSKIGAAAAFIAYNKYSTKVNSSISTSESTSPPRVEYPQSLFIHSEYSARDIEPIVKVMLDMAVKVEAAGNQRSRPAILRDRLPVMIYDHYRKVGVVSTAILPNFNAFFDRMRAEAVTSSSDKTEDKAESDHDPVEQENPEES